MAKFEDEFDPEDEEEEDGSEIHDYDEDDEEEESSDEGDIIQNSKRLKAAQQKARLANQARKAQEVEKISRTARTAAQAEKAVAEISRLARLARLFAAVGSAVVSTVSAIIGFLAATWIFWLILIIIVVLVVIVMAFVSCDESVIGGGLLKSFMEDIGVCALTRTEASTIGPTPIQTQTNPGDPNDLVSLNGAVPISGASDPRVRSCMYNKVTSFFARAKTYGLNIVLTSAFRRGATTSTGPSAHGRGEAVDIALVNPPPKPWGTAPLGQTMNRFNVIRQKDIQTLIEIGEDLGFTPIAGDTLDEYNFPTDKASGPHVHIEYNSGFCDVSW